KLTTQEALDVASALVKGGPPRPPDNPKDDQPGVRYEVYSGNWDRLPDFDKIGYDFLQSVEEIRQQQQHVIDKWEQLPGRPGGEPAAAILIDPDGRLMWDRINRLHSQRDDRRVNLVE
ncbi:MAG: hypothetical protein QGH11_03555, partial [Pirellulaceae bacterium]|nr:hypothetical protein [Pirellulaceae bacterium]